MKRLTRLWNDNASKIVICLGVAGLLTWLLLYHLGTLVGGMSANEIKTVTEPVGWHGIWNQPFDLPLKVLRSVIFFAADDYGQLLSRLPNAIMGAAAIICFGMIVSVWHNRRTAIFTSLLFATSAWVLHVSRLASSDVLYLWAMPILLAVQILLHKYVKKRLALYVTFMIWGLLLYIPGLVWLVLAQIYLQRKAIAANLKHFKSFWHTLLALASLAIWLPLLIINLLRPSNLTTWLGLPDQFPSLLTLLKQFAAVPVHLFIRGPEYPDLWLGKAPILDVFTLLACLLGIYFYATHWRSIRSRSLGILLLIGGILVGLGGPVGLSLLVPLLYVGAATGIAYLLKDWLKVFPNNPLARGLGIGLIVLAVGLSSLYNLRAYFIVWPHNDTTKTTFIYHR